jgi:hypothetical protein
VLISKRDDVHLPKIRKFAVPTNNSIQKFIFWPPFFFLKRKNKEFYEVTARNFGTWPTNGQPIATKCSLFSLLIFFSWQWPTEQLEQGLIFFYVGGAARIMIIDCWPTDFSATTDHGHEPIRPCPIF